MFNFVRMFIFLVLLIGGVCGFMALLGQGASEGLALLDGFDPTDFSAVGTRSTAVPAAPVALEPVPPAADLVAPAEAAAAEAVVAPSGQVKALATSATTFRFEADPSASNVWILEGTELVLLFEHPTQEGWYGVVYSVNSVDYRGYVRMAEINLPDGLYTRPDLRTILPLGEW